MVKERNQQNINNNFFNAQILDGEKEKAFSVIDATSMERMCGLLRSEKHTFVLDHGEIYNIH